MLSLIRLIITFHIPDAAQGKILDKYLELSNVKSKFNPTISGQLKKISRNYLP